MFKNKEEIREFTEALERFIISTIARDEQAELGNYYEKNYLRELLEEHFLENKVEKNNDC